MFILESRICDLLTKHKEIGELITTVINLIKIAVPIVLIIMGMLDFAKAAAGGKQDDINKGKQIFLKRCITGALVFFVVAIVQLAIELVAYATGGNDASNNNIWSCVNTLINS